MIFRLSVIQVLDEGSGKAVEDGLHTGVPAAHVGDPDEALDSWLQPGPTLGHCNHLGMNQHTEDLLLALCFSPSFSSSFPPSFSPLPITNLSKT